MHDVLGNAERAAHWEDRASALGEIINRKLWCARTHFYHDCNISHRFVASKTAAGFWPLLAGICDHERTDALVAHLQDEREFDRPTPVPALSADDPNYSSHGEYWIGGVWPPICYMVARGLLTAGRGDVAHEIALKYISALARTYAHFTPHTLWECMSPEEDKPGTVAYGDALVKPEFVGWAGIGPIAMLIENVLGIEANAPEGRIEWTIRLTGEHGIRNLSLGQLGKVTLLCAARKSVGDPAQVQIAAERPLQLLLHRDGKVARASAAQGKKTVATV
jgi:glycogen debranching enzyme